MKLFENVTGEGSQLILQWEDLNSKTQLLLEEQLWFIDTGV